MFICMTKTKRGSSTRPTTKLPRTRDGRHQFKWMKFDGVSVRIDKDIASLLSKMWKLGIRTTNSCHGSCSFMCKHKYIVRKSKHGDYYKPVPTKDCHDSVWLAFESSFDVELLYNIVAEYPGNEDDGTMYSKMCCGRFVTTKGSKFRRSPEGWAFMFLLENNGVSGHWGRPVFNGRRSTQEMWIEDGCERNDFVIQPQITFPRAHIKWVEDKLDLALKRKRQKKNVVGR